MVELDHYQTLGLSPKASKEEIRRAYKKLCQKYHPDKNKAPDADEFFMRIKNAYDTLSDPKRKALYDTGVKQNLNPEEFRRLLSSLVNRIVAQSLGEIETFGGNWLINAKKQLANEKTETKLTQGKMKKREKFLLKELNKIKSGADSFLGQALLEQLKAIKAGLETARVGLAVIEFLSSDMEAILYEMEEENSNPRLAIEQLNHILGNGTRWT